MKLKAKTIVAKTHEEWLSNRRAGIGGSDAAAAIGASKWTDPVSLWLEKLGLRDSVVENEAMYWGHVHEPAIGARHAELTGRLVKRPSNKGEYVIHEHPEHDFLLATLDFLQKDTERGWGILECKSTGSMYADPEEYENDGMPIEWEIQLQHQLMVTGLEWGSIACLIRGNKLVQVDYDRNDAFIAVMMEKEIEFWDMVVRKIQPEFDGSKSSAEALLHLYPKEKPGKVVQLPDEALLWDERLRELKELRKEIEQEEEAIKSRLKVEIGEAEVGVLPGAAGVWRFKSVERAGYTVAPKTYRELRRAKK